MINRRGIRAAATSLARAVLGGGEATAPLQLRSATITAVKKTVTPWTVTINLSGVLVPGVTILGWADPYVGDRVQVLQQGQVLFVLGPPAPGRIYNPSTPVPAPPTRPASELNPSPLGPESSSVSVEPTSSSTVTGTSAWRNDALHQGGNAVAQRGYWFYGNALQTARGSGTALEASVFIKRIDYAGPEVANVRLGTHTQPVRPPVSSALNNVAVVGTLRRGEGKFFALTPAMLAGINSGTVKGFGLEPGQLGLDSPDYLVAHEYGVDKEWSGTVSMTVRS